MSCTAAGVSLLTATERFPTNTWGAVMITASLPEAANEHTHPVSLVVGHHWDTMSTVTLGTGMLTTVCPLSLCWERACQPQTAQLMSLPRLVCGRQR